MLTPAITSELGSVFRALENTVTLRIAHSAHPDQDELLQMLSEVASTSDRIRIEFDSKTVKESPYFEIANERRQNKVAFRGVPGGHEFSSLVLAILNCDAKGKLPDNAIINRIKNIRGSIRLKTYVSLSCENCPDVVQALNLMAFIHDDFFHETIDGGIAEHEVKDLGLQGVPSVVVDGELFHSGRIQFNDLLTKLEHSFGKEPQQKQSDLGQFDVVVIGGGPAGSSAAIYSARKGLKTALIAETLGGQLKETKGIENMISIPYTEGARLSADLSQHLAQYPIQIFEHRRVTKISGDTRKRLEIEGGEFLEASTLILATGARWRRLGIPGEAEHIGQGVAFCAHCDGPFYKNKKVVVVGGGNSGVEAAIDLAGIAREVTLLEFNETLKADEVLITKLSALSNTHILTHAEALRIIGLNSGAASKVVGIEYRQRATHTVNTLSTDGVFVQIGLSPNSSFVKNYVDLNAQGEIIVDSRGRTSQPGVYAAGDVTPIAHKQIVVAMGDGAKVALTAFEDRIRRA